MPNGPRQLIETHKVLLSFSLICKDISLKNVVVLYVTPFLAILFVFIQNI